MPKSKKKSSNNKRASRPASEVSDDASIPVPTMEQLLSIESVMCKMAEERDLDDKLDIGQWILKPKCKNHKVYYRYVVLKDKICKQSVTHSCTSGRNANRDRIHDLSRPYYTSVGGVMLVVKSEWVLQNNDVYHP